MQNHPSQAAFGEHIGLPDDAWEILAKLLPPERGRGCRPAKDNRVYFEGMLWIARTGSPWRHLPVEYGKWNSVYRRFQRWSAAGVFVVMQKALSYMVARDTAASKINDATVKAYICVICIQRELTKPSLWADREVPSHKDLLAGYRSHRIGPRAAIGRPKAQPQSPSRPNTARAMACANPGPCNG